MMLLAIFLAFIVCASGAINDEGRILGGSIVPDGKYPSMCSLRKNGNHECGCTIISDTYVLTTATCTDALLTSMLSVHVGSTHVYAGGQVYQVNKVTKHNLYDPQDPSSPDIALLELDESMLLSDLVQPVQLPSQGAALPISEGVALGWGWTTDVAPLSPDLLEIPQTVYSETDCLAKYPSVTSSQMCVEGTSQGVCNKDMGGPLMVNGVLEGIAAYAPTPTGCAGVTSGTPAVFVRVSMFRDWITDISGVLL